VGNNKRKIKPAKNIEIDAEFFDNAVKKGWITIVDRTMTVNLDFIQVVRVVGLIEKKPVEQTRTTESRRPFSETKRPHESHVDAARRK
jgi:hypothetical protein